MAQQQPSDAVPPPSDPAAEQAILGAILRAAQDDTTAATALLEQAPEPSDYYRPAHEAIAAHLAKAAADGAPLDPAALLGRLTDAHDLSATGGAGYLHTLIQAAAPDGALAYHAARVQQAAQRRRALHALTRAHQRITNADPDDTGALYEAMSDLEDAATDPTRKAVTTSWAPVSLDAALEGRELDPPPTLMPRTDGQHLVHAGAIHSLSGEPESGKTWIALNAAVDELDNGGRVVIIDFEDRPARVVARLLALGAHPDAIRERLAYVRPHDALNDTARPRLEQTITGASLVVIDGVTEAMTLHGLEIESNRDIATFYALLPRWIATRGPAVVLIDHVVKDSDRQGRWSIGGQHKLAGLDGVAYIVKTAEPFGRGKHGISRVVISKDRPGYVREFALGNVAAEFHLDATGDIMLARLDPATEVPKDDHGEMRPTILMERVSRFIEINAGVTRNMIEEAVRGKREYVRKALDALVREEFVEARPGARRAVHHYSLDAFRTDEEADDDPRD